MKPTQLYLKLLRWGIFVSLLIPLIIFSQYLSPFHFGKIIVFRSLVEILAAIYILLIIADKKYFPRFTLIVASFTIFTGLYALTSFTGVDFNYSFWGTLERMGGLFSFLHFWVFFIILISVFRERKDWERLLKTSVFVGLLSILFAYGQRFIQGKFFIGWQHGERLIGTIGNPALFAGYLLFVLFLSLYFLMRKETNSFERIFYGVVLISGVPVLHLTAVRGSIIAFWGALFLLGLFYLILPASPAGGLKNKKIRILIFAALLVFLLLAGFIWLNRDQAWVKNSSWLNRITSISLKESTAQTRFWSWQSGFEGWKERPILGWGPENFVIAHAEHFNPRHFTGFGSETIWDRAHNMVLETLTTMGIVGCLSYLSIFVAIYFLLIKRFKEKKIKLTDIGIFGVMIIAYFIHNLFIFDTAANYYMFFLVLGYINFMSLRNENSPSEASAKEGKEKRPNPLLIIILVILAAVLIYKTNIEPAKANYACTRAILLGRTGDAQKTFDKYKEALSYRSPQGKYEIRNKLVTFIIQYIEVLRQKEKKLNQEVFNYTMKEVEKNIKDHPLDYIPYLYKGRLYILLISDDPQLAGREAEAAIRGAIAINNRNPRIWYELGQLQLSQKKYAEAVESFRGALELNPEVRESNWFLGMAYAQVENYTEALKYANIAIEKGYEYKSSTSDILRLIDIYKQTGDYYKIIDCYKIAIELQPKNAQFYAALATAYKMVGDKENAALYAKKASEIDPRFKEDSETFLKSLK